MPDPWFRITTQSPEDNHIPQIFLKFLFSAALNSILSLMHQMHQGLSASFLFMPCHSIPNSANNLKSYVMYHLSQSHITYNRYIARLPDYPPVSYPGITKCLVKVRGCPIPLTGSRPQQVEVVSSPGRWPHSAAAIPAGPAPAASPSSSGQWEAQVNRLAALEGGRYFKKLKASFKVCSVKGEAQNIAILF